MSSVIHPTAIVSPKAILGNNVNVGPYCIVDEDVEIGDSSILRSFVHIYPHVKLGERCEMWDHVVLGASPQHFQFKGEKSFVRIGDSVVMRELVTIHRATGEGEVTSIGDDCYLMEGTHIGHNAKIGNKVTIANKVGLAGYVEIGNNVVLGGMAGIHQFVRVGDYCMIGGLSKLVKDVPPYLMADGRPARVYNINAVGLRRAGFNSEDRKNIRYIYKEVYQSGLPFREAISMLKTRQDPSICYSTITKFFDIVKRGLTPWVRHGKTRDECD